MARLLFAKSRNRLILVSEASGVLDTSFFAFLQFVGGSTGSTGDDSNDVRALKNTASGGSTSMPLGAILGTFFFECIRSCFSFTHQY